MKFLTVCDGGNVRSAGLAYVLKNIKNQEAVAIGRLMVSKETMRYFCEWADIIVIMQAHMIESIDPDFHSKVRCVDVGEDVFGVYVHPKLLEMVNAGADWLLSNHQGV